MDDEAYARLGMRPGSRPAFLFKTPLKKRWVEFHADVMVPLLVEHRRDPRSGYVIEVVSNLDDTWWRATRIK